MPGAYQVIPWTPRLPQHCALYEKGTSARRVCPDIPGYTRVVKIAVSIPDSLFEAGDQLARRRKMSRSQLYAIALESLLAAEDDTDITTRLNAVYAADPPADETRPMRHVITVRESW